MQTTAYDKLDTNWKNWMIGSIQAGCTAESMLEAMVENGPFSELFATKAIMEAHQEIFPETRGYEPENLYPYPDIDTRSNHIDLDRRIDILVTMDSPRIVVMDNLLSDEECDRLIASAEHALVRSRVVHADSTADIEDSARTSSYAMFQRGETELLETIEKRLAALANWPIEKGEGLQVLHYKTGEYYVPHFDWFNPDLAGHHERLKQGGQRVGTFVLYLSDPEKG